MLERGDDESADPDTSGQTRSCVHLVLVVSAAEED
jgi:hypothetical protein